MFVNQISGQVKTVRDILAHRRYNLDYYQREFNWQSEHVKDMVDDLCAVFREHYNPNQLSNAVLSYGEYFLGSMIVHSSEDGMFVVDGQQRITSLTLLLMCLFRGLHVDMRSHVSDCIYTQQVGGDKTFNIDVEERNILMSKLFCGTEVADIETDNMSASASTILGRYRDIEEHFVNQGIDETALPVFADWLLSKVVFVYIETDTEKDAYTIFETMNDRGLSLSPTEILKGYLLSNISHKSSRKAAKKIWNDISFDLEVLKKGEFTDFVRSWLRSQYGHTIEDFHDLSATFHRWVKKEEESMGLVDSKDFSDMFTSKLVFYAAQYKLSKNSSTFFSEALLPEVYFTSYFDFKLQYPPLLASLTTNDTAETIIKKIRLVSTYFDIFLARRIWNFKLVSQAVLERHLLLDITRNIRGMTVSTLSDFLLHKLEEQEENFTEANNFGLHKQNRKHVHWILARLTDYIEVECFGTPSNIEMYFKKSGSDKYEIEHVWANNFSNHTKDFDTAVDFELYRNRIGGLLLLPKSFNSAFGKSTYEEKLPHYFGQNLLAASLSPMTYTKNPKFKQFVSQTGLPFVPHEHFRKADLDSRQKLYGMLAERIWHPDRLIV